MLIRMILMDYDQNCKEKYRIVGDEYDRCHLSFLVGERIV